jgi:hypothetical protein
MNAQYYNQNSCANILSVIFPVSYYTNKIIFTILFSVYLILSVIRFSYPGILITSIILGLGLLALILLSNKIRREYIAIYIFAGFLATSFLISSLFVSRTEEIPRIFLHIVSCTGIAMILLRGYVYNWAGYIVFYGIVIYFMIRILAGVDGDSALTLSSHNGISMVMLVACISLYIILSMENKQFGLMPAIFTLVISIWGIGRSGIVSSFVLFIGLLFIMLHAKPKRYIIVIFICLIMAFIFFDSLYMLFIKYINVGTAIDLYLDRGVESSIRKEIWGNYINNLDISRLIFGVNVFTDPWPDKEILAYNYHNSFISLHSKVGFMGLITIALMIISLFKYRKTNLLYFFLFLTVILRWSTDYGLFFDSFDFIPFFFIFYYLKNNLFSSFKFSILPFGRCQRIDPGKLI